MHIYANHSPKVISEIIIYHEAEETISETSKDYIDIASDKKVLKGSQKQEFCTISHYFFGLVKRDKYSLTNITMLLWLETVRWFSIGSTQEMWCWEATKTFGERGIAFSWQINIIHVRAALNGKVC